MKKIKTVRLSFFKDDYSIWSRKTKGFHAFAIYFDKGGKIFPQYLSSGSMENLSEEIQHAKRGIRIWRRTRPYWKNTPVNAAEWQEVVRLGKRCSPAFDSEQTATERLRTQLANSRYAQEYLEKEGVDLIALGAGKFTS